MPKVTAGADAENTSRKFQTDQKMRAFLRQLYICGRLNAAADASGIDRVTVFRWKRTDWHFRQAFDLQMERHDSEHISDSSDWDEKSDFIAYMVHFCGYRPAFRFTGLDRSRLSALLQSDPCFAGQYQHALDSVYAEVEINLLRLLRGDAQPDDAAEAPALPERHAMLALRLLSARKQRKEQDVSDMIVHDPLAALRASLLAIRERQQTQNAKAIDYQSQSLEPRPMELHSGQQAHMNGFTPAP